jgi:hypothetical protein
MGQAVPVAGLAVAAWHGASIEAQNTHVPRETGANTGELAEQIRAARPLGPGASELVRGGGDG